MHEALIDDSDEDVEIIIQQSANMISAEFFILDSICFYTYGNIMLHNAVTVAKCEFESFQIDRKGLSMPGDTCDRACACLLTRMPVARGQRRPSPPCPPPTEAREGKICPFERRHLGIPSVLYLDQTLPRLHFPVK